MPSRLQVKWLAEKIGRYIDNKNDGHLAENIAKFVIDHLPYDESEEEKLETVSTLLRHLVFMGGIAYVGFPGAGFLTVAYWLGKRYCQNYAKQENSAIKDSKPPEDRQEFESVSDEGEFFSCDSSLVGESGGRLSLHDATTQARREDGFFSCDSEFGGHTGANIPVQDVETPFEVYVDNEGDEFYDPGAALLEDPDVPDAPVPGVQEPEADQGWWDMLKEWACRCGTAVVDTACDALDWSKRILLGCWENVKGFACNVGATVRNGFDWIRRTFWQEPLNKLGNWAKKNIVNPVADFFIETFMERATVAVNSRISDNPLAQSLQREFSAFMAA